MGRWYQPFNSFCGRPAKTACWKVFTQVALVNRGEGSIFGRVNILQPKVDTIGLGISAVNKRQEDAANGPVRVAFNGLTRREAPVPSAAASSLV